jgi:hypothetical protein
MGQRYSSVVGEMNAVQVRKTTKAARIARDEEKRQARLRHHHHRQDTEAWAKKAAWPIIEGIERQIESAAAAGRYKIMWRLADKPYDDLQQDCLNTAVARHFKQLGFKVTGFERTNSFARIRWK